MKIRNVRWEGKFDSIQDPRRPHRRITVNAITVRWEWRPDGTEAWRSEMLFIPAGTSWDGASRPEIFGFAVPRYGVFSLASLVHDMGFVQRPFLSSGERISRKHTDALFFEIMKLLAEQRVDSGWKAPAQMVLADVMHAAVRWFGAETWDHHDKEFAAKREDPNV